MAEKKKEETPVAVPSPVVFTKAKLLTLTRFAGRRDLLSALLTDGKEYTLDQAETLIREFLEKGKVK